MSVASVGSNGYCYTPLTPQSSAENITGARSTSYRAAAPAVRPPPINDTSSPKPIERSPSHTAPTSHLHTPASSVDINPKAMKVCLCLSLKSVITNLCQLLDDIKHLDFAASGQVFVGAQIFVIGLYSLSPDVWRRRSRYLGRVRPRIQGVLRLQVRRALNLFRSVLTEINPEGSNILLTTRL